VLGEGKAHGGPGGLYWYEAPSSGNLSDPWIKHTITNSGNFYEDIAIFDVNGDGAPDIIASDNNQLVWFENPLGHVGNPATDPWPVHVIRAGGGTHVIVLGDIDGDGKTDIICSSSGLLGSSGAILFQNTPDSWTELRFGTVGESVALLDIGSGMGRINIAGGDGKSVVWYENPRESGGHARTGAWIRHVAATLTDAGKDAFASGVFSSSDRMDLIVASNADLADYFGSIPHTDLLKSVVRRIVDQRALHLIKMWLESGAGLYRIVAPVDRRSAWTVQTIDSTYQAVHGISVGDMNKDGTLDFVALEEEQAHNVGPGFNQNFNNQKVAVWYNDGNGNFTQQIIATTGGHNQVLGDIEGDGDLDILSANHGYYGAPNPLEIWVNQLNHKAR
jgi:FG-GAP-like repeat